MAQQWAAGERIVADKLSTYAGEPVIREINSPGFTTTEVVIDTLVVPLVNGRRYKIVWKGGFFSSGTTDLVRAQLREDSVSGTLMQVAQTAPSVINQKFDAPMEAFYTAVATSNKTFVATGDRIAGAGTITANAGAGFPTLFYAENA